MPQTAEQHLAIDFGVLTAEPAEEYHAKAGEYLSSHLLIDFIRCPKLYHKKLLGLIEEEATYAMVLGSATHVRILEGKAAYEQQFALGGPINKTTGKPFGRETKAFARWAKSQGRPGIHSDDLPLIEDLAGGVRACEKAGDLLRHGRSEGVLRAEYCGLACQCRFDWIHPHRGIIDLKTTRDLDRFVRDIRDYRYLNQVAFYQAVLAQAIGDLVPVYLVAIEKKEPFRCGIWRLGDGLMAGARRENEDAIERLHQCRATDHWPTGYEDIRVLDSL